MRAIDVLETARAGGRFQLAANELIDDFRRASPAEREAMVRDPILEPGRVEALVAGIVSALCREAGMDPPSWVDEIGSPTPFFPFPARSFAMRVRLMLESPAPFRVRNVFVPENYMSRA